MPEVLSLKKSNCKNCYKCIRHCPVKSIRFSGNQAHIVGDECILCGQCFVICPQDAKQIADGTETAKMLMQSGHPVYVSLAPSFIANYNGVGIEGMTKALKELGFAGVEETALGATLVKNEYERILREEGKNILISSCCHSINLLIQKYYPSLLPYLANVVSPMQTHCLDIKRRHPEAKTVFIGPCVAKKDEVAAFGDVVDAALTFEELTRWLEETGIVPEKGVDNTPKSRARLFPTTGGILQTMKERQPDTTYLALDGVENCMAALEDIASGNLDHCFIEMSACVGSCIGGPVMEKYHRSPVRDTIAVNRYAGGEDFEVTAMQPEQAVKYMAPLHHKLNQPTEMEIQEALKKMGKTKPEDELNCGSCGYDTCREKAIALVQGKADVSMCLPFLKERAETFSDNIINNTPNGIVVLNDSLEVQQINRAAMGMMNIARESDVMGEPVVRILDPKAFLEVQTTGRSLRNQRVYLAEYNRYVEQSIILDKEYRVLICIMRDVSDEQSQREKREEISRQTVEIADKVVDKQMRIVQEIASLLGETTAETKVALTKLKEYIADE